MQSNNNRPQQRPSNNGPAKPGQNKNNNRRRRYKGNFNKNKTPNPSSQIDRLVEKYINLLDQHLIARRKYHDLYYRAELPQLNKLERLFYQSLNDLRDFEAKIAPDIKDVFEKRVNGLRPDITYSSNHQLDPNAVIVLVSEENIEDPHLLTSQKSKNYKEDIEESVGSIEDYNKYKNL